MNWPRADNVAPASLKLMFFLSQPLKSCNYSVDHNNIHHLFSWWSLFWREWDGVFFLNALNIISLLNENLAETFSWWYIFLRGKSIRINMPALELNMCASVSGQCAGAIYRIKDRKADHDSHGCAVTLATRIYYLHFYFW